MKLKKCVKVILAAIPVITLSALYLATYAKKQHLKILTEAFKNDRQKNVFDIFTFFIIPFLCFFCLSGALFYDSCCAL